MGVAQLLEAATDALPVPANADIPSRPVARPILYVLEDEPSLAELVRVTAEKAEFDCVCFGDSGLFVRALKRYRPDAMTLDLQVGDADCFDTMKRIAAAAADTPALLISGVEERLLQAAATHGTEAGLKIAGWFRKPFEPTALFSQLGAIARRATPALSVDLQAAIERRQIFPHFQPCIDMRTGAISAFEALARWNHPRLGSIPPDRFIVVAEASGLMRALTLSMIVQSLDFLSSLPVRAGSPAPRVAVNFPPSLLMEENLTDVLRAQVKARGMSPEQLILEITETAACIDLPLAVASVAKLRLAGFRVALDDFGTGYSSLTELHRLPVDTVKLDRSYVSAVTTDRVARQIVQSVTNLAHSIGLRVVAEGIENEVMLQVLADIGCDIAQGYAIARPMDAEAARLWFTGYAPKAPGAAG